MPEMIQFRPGGLSEPLAQRADSGLSADLVAKRDLERYYESLGLGLKDVELTEAEASLIVDALNGSLMDTTSARLLWAEIADCELGGKWGVDTTALMDKLRELTPFESLAIVDAAERYWVTVAGATELSHAELLQSVGLIR